MKIYDCFIFFNELDILELRLNILNPYVDYFVLCESNYTHSGIPKPFYFEENKERFAEFLPKIIHLKITDCPQQFTDLPINPNPTTFDERCLNDIYLFIKHTTLFNRVTEPHYGRDFFQKECTRRALENCNDDDIIISSDVDEIPNPTALMKTVAFLSCGAVHGTFYSFKQKSYYYYLNMFQQPDWYGSRIGLYRDLEHFSFNQLRKQENLIIQDGGWHFSFQGGPDRVRQKIESYSHQDLNTDHIKDNISSNMEKNIDPFFRSTLSLVNIDDSFPEYLRNNIDKYKHMIK